MTASGDAVPLQFKADWVRPVILYTFRYAEIL